VERPASAVLLAGLFRVYGGTSRTYRMITAERAYVCRAIGNLSGYHRPSSCQVETNTSNKPSITRLET